MNKKINLSGIQDIDLIMLKEHRYFYLEGAIYEALAAYTRGYECVIEVPQKTDIKVHSLKKQIQIKLDDEKDDDIIRMLTRIKKGSMTAAVKAIVRNYLSRPYIDMLFCDESLFDLDRTEKRQKSVVKRPKSTQAEKPATAVSQTQPTRNANYNPENTDTSSRGDENRDHELSSNTDTWDIFADNGFVENY